MTYSVKEIYYTLQGEGANTGRPAVFLRFSGCNLWSGLEEGRTKGPGGCSKWCDTNFVGTDGPNGAKFSTAAELADRVRNLWTGDMSGAKGFVVCTGGEPLLQLDEALVVALHQANFEIAVETNGTMLPPAGIDWLTVSPKENASLRLNYGHELKLVYPQKGMDPESYEQLHYEHFYLQPLDGPQSRANTEQAVAYCLSHPRWRLSVQTHKFIGIP
jgi:7-carboxy-7-deazaguanine synthase